MSSLLAGSSSRKGPVLARSTADAEAPDAYGTFHASAAVHSQSAARPNKSTLLRAAGLTGALLLAAGCLSVSSPSSSAVVANVDAPVDVVPTVANADVVHNVASADAIPAVNDATETADKLNAVERAFIDGIDPEHMREYLHMYSSKSHISGSAGDYETAIYTLEKFRSFGLEAEIKEYYTLLSLPVHRRLAIVEPSTASRELNLTEATVPGDSCTTDPDAQPPFLAYSPSGNVTAPVVYLNYGTQADFALLEARNVTLKGKIALMRYGGNYRGLKALAAVEHGMAGALIYSDPQDDGFVVGPVYPDGPWRPEDSFQRGSIYNDCGDPLTPGYASVLGCEYIDYEDATGIPKIPSLPLSYGQAKHILAALGGSKAPESWQGGLTFSDGYHIGDDDSTVLTLELEMDNKIGPIWDVVATIPGAVEPERQILMGNHRDAWVCGAIDPNSGSSTMLEIARNFGELLRTGWRPRRTIKLASWDAEEQGLLGSTEYAEELAEELSAQAVAYLNVDTTLGPIALAGGTPSIAKILFSTADSIPPNKFGSVEVAENTLYEQWLSQTKGHKSLGTIGPDHMISVLGTGSDQGAYTDHLGIVSSSIGFGFDGPSYGTYHSTMDSVMYSELYADPHYATHVATANWWGLLALRLADTELLPLDFSTYSLVMREALDEFESQLAATGLADVDLSSLYAAVEKFGANAEQFHTELEAFRQQKDKDELELSRWNDKLAFLERQLLLSAGLPHRNWYKHVVFGPGFYDGYGGTAFPGLADAIAFKDNTTAVQAHVVDLIGVVNGATAFLLA